MTTSEDSWLQKGITFVILTQDDLQDVLKIYRETFYVDSPLLKATKVAQGEGLFVERFKHEQDQKVVVGPLNCEKPARGCMAAKKDGKIIAARLGSFMYRSEVGDPAGSWFNRVVAALPGVPTFLPVPEKAMAMGHWKHVVDSMRFHPAFVFEDLNNHFDDNHFEMIYMDSGLVVEESYRGLGLGMELCKRTMEIAEKSGCDATYNMAASKFSQSIFTKLGFETLHEKDYADFKTDARGRQCLGDMGVHKVIRSVVYKHK